MVVTAFAAWFRLVNLAEDQGLVRQLTADRQRNAEAGDDGRSPRRSAPRSSSSPRPGSTPTQAAEALGQLAVRLVLTAHPTEAKRRTTLTKLGRVADALRELDRAGCDPRGPAARPRRTWPRRSRRCG